MTMSISFQDCKSALLDKSGDAGHDAYDEWCARPDGKEVVEFVEGFTHSHLLTLTTASVREVMNTSGHALGDVDAKEQLQFIENFTCPFALQHIFHGYIERKQHVPTWEQFDEYVKDEVASMWMNPMRVFLKNCPTVKDFVRGHGRDIGWEKVKRAIQWRLGKFYYSAMRELDIFVRLREGGAPVSYHIFADVLLRVDFWIDTKLVCVYFSNSAYQDGKQGRKKPTASFFNDPNHQFNIHHINIERQGFGNFWIASEDSMTKLIDTLTKS